ncbi:MULTISPECIES: REP-associated tyrosine transposase [Avibacterium]
MRESEIMPNYRRDFTKGACYFFTLTLQDRTKCYLTQHIEKLRQAYQETVRRYPFETIAICVLPDHLHFIMQLPQDDDNYSKRIAFFKTIFTKLLPTAYRNENQSRIKKREAGIWQRRFWEHRIRDERDLNNHLDYIYFNPVKHGYVNAPKDWPFSSFRRDVERGFFPLNWGS